MGCGEYSTLPPWRLIRSSVPNSLAPAEESAEADPSRAGEEAYAGAGWATVTCSFHGLRRIA
ncbi:hypothetical protein GCM10010329_82730 [Streptomyces spiroverticillatus]|uniref:Uncharacterized protein n=1 Tax=Streptomyces finlayi TaxID=67296 RepID=A0A918X8X3_9ACTN|nr:hypothetical protein GCM10010329_82730 [Streptomyces spiroverticillatus]GHD18724.1 hypothetical protein GCM10010334_81800 [Streptomyces finlayi]